MATCERRCAPDTESATGPTGADPEGQWRGATAARDSDHPRSVVQTAAVLVLEPIFEADFAEAAYGYRPRRSALDAVRQVSHAIDKGHAEVADADLSKYFDTIPHAALMTSVARRINDGQMLRLIKRWLKAPVVETDERGIVA